MTRETRTVTSLCLKKLPMNKTLLHELPCAFMNAIWHTLLLTMRRRELSTSASSSVVVPPPQPPPLLLLLLLLTLAKLAAIALSCSPRDANLAACHVAYVVEKFVEHSKGCHESKIEIKSDFMACKPRKWDTLTDLSLELISLTSTSTFECDPLCPNVTIFVSFNCQQFKQTFIRLNLAGDPP